jgi:type IV pilus assembly protein PilW
MNTARSMRMKGMGLVELMVWVAISLLVTTVIGTIYVNSKQVTRVNDTISRLQENGRFVIHLLDRDLRMAGFRGCNSLAVTPVNLLGSTAYAYQFGTGLQGFYGSGGSWSPNLDASIGALTPAPMADTDVITIRHIDGPGVPLIAAMTSQTSDITVAPGSNLATGDILLIADCGAATIFNATAYDAGSGAISHASGGAAIPGNSTDDLGHVFGTGASVYRLVTRTYFIAPSVKKSGTNTLWAFSVPAYDGQPQPEEMVEGVDKFALVYGEDLDGDRAANRYVNAGAVGTWGNIVSVKAQVLLATVRDNMATSSQPYTFNGTTTTPTDKKMRTVLSSVITVRNRVP